MIAIIQSNTNYADTYPLFSFFCSRLEEKRLLPVLVIRNDTSLDVKLCGI